MCCSLFLAVVSAQNELLATHLLFDKGAASRTAHLEKIGQCFFKLVLCNLS